MKITILSLKGVEWQGEAAGLNIKTKSGEITVLDHHRPLMTMLERGKGYVLKNDGGRVPLEARGGFLEMSPENELSVLVR